MPSVDGGENGLESFLTDLFVIVQEDGEIGLDPISTHDFAKLDYWSAAASDVTHPSSQARRCCIFLNRLIVSFVHGYSRDVALAQLREKVRDDVSQDLRMIVEDDFLRIDARDIVGVGTCFNTFMVALWAFYTSESYRGTIERAVSIGGDTDTQAAVAGALAGTYYGYSSIPEEWCKQICNKNRLESIAGGLMDFAERK